jgi:large subunit ribosomal protein L1
MGKIRVKGLEEMTPEEEAKQKAKKEAKKAEKIAAKNAQRAAEGKKVNPQTEAIVNETAEVVSEAPAEEVTTTPSETVETTDAEEAPKKKKKEKFVKARTKVESKRHKENQTHVSKNQSYNISQGLEALRKFKSSKFDETVELHINTKEKGINGQVVLPHGTGKTLVIKIADEAIIAEVAKGKINFDVLVAVPSMMPQLARVAKVLGPRGLMPNPKNGTITDKPEEAVK